MMDMNLKQRLILVLLGLCLCGNLPSQSLLHFLENHPEIQAVEALESTHFPEKYLVRFTQPIDPEHPKTGTFEQRVFVHHRGTDRPTVMVAEGYGAHYALNPRYHNELAMILDANILVVEHRYFLESTPEPCDWQYFNGRNEAHDLHCIHTAFEAFYHGPWAVTGASKGGHNTLIYTAHYPKDMDLAVPYVGPLCRSVEDGRHEPFLADTVGTAAERKHLYDLQIEFLKRKEALLPALDSLCQANHYEFNLPLREIYDYTVLEFPFAYWQVGFKAEHLPAMNASNADFFKAFVAISDPGYFVKESDTTPFFIQAAKELGYYGYDLEPFRAYTDIQSTEGYLKKIFLPKGLSFDFDASLYHQLIDFLQNGEAQMIFIYGANDPWSAVRVPDFGRENIRIYNLPEACHGARILAFPEETKNEILDYIQQWIND